MLEQDLNEAVALDVMNFTKQKFKGQDGFGTPDGRIFFSYFNPSTEISDAWKVVDKLKENQIHFRMASNRSGYFIEFWNEAKDIQVSCEHKIVEKAICTAAIKITQMLHSGDKSTTQTH